MEGAIVEFKASDGSDVRLSPGIVAKYIVTGGQQVDDRELFSFMAKCQARRLNPLAGDAYMTAYRNGKTGRVEASVIVSKDYFVRTATQQPGFDGIRAGIVVVARGASGLSYREGTIWGRQTERLVGGWAEVYDKGRTHPSRSEVSLDEYDQHRSLWKTKPATMIRKVALVQALREAYPGAYGGIYDGSEMPGDDRVPEPPAEACDPVAYEAEASEQSEMAGEAEAEAMGREAEATQAAQDAEAGWESGLADEDYEF